MTSIGIGQKDAFVIGIEEPLNDYIHLIETKVTVDELVDDVVIKENFLKISQAARDIIWKLLFSEEYGDADSQKKASELLEEHKSDACFYSPFSYNEWIVGVRDELLKRQLIDFWRDSIVAKQLGPCWSRDSDLFDSGDEAPLEFYAHAGCKAPFAASLKIRAGEKAASLENVDPSNEALREPDNAAALTSDPKATISATNPLGDHRDCVISNDAVPDDLESTIWQLLFKGTPTKEEVVLAAKLLQVYKSDASFNGPWTYNEWIVKLRDELLQRNMLAFWGDIIVKKELGPCCIRDSDFFESDDPLPLEFYNKAGFKAPFTTRDN